MTDVDSLKEAITQYELQLAQVEATLTTTAKGPDRDNLLSLKSDIEELISLTKESLESLENDTAKADEDILDDDEDPLAKEYALFKAELEECSDVSENVEADSSATKASDNLEDEFKELQGTKCRVPYRSSWGSTGYHNAMVCSAYKESDDDSASIESIKVRVFFINPTHREMLPCPYFLDGKCRFSDEQCRFSHGEIVSLSSLQEYREPDFSSIKVGSRVLTKQKNNLWHRSIVLKLPEKDGSNCCVKLEVNGNIMEIDLQDVLPLDIEISDTSDESDSDSVELESENSEAIHRSLLIVQPNEPLGNWEKHTRGIGSKLMAQMGYIVGTGLGKRADGRINPVEATVLPAGKSLDHCMELRENAGGDRNLFSVERRMQKQQKKLEKQRERQYHREKERERSNVFNFINTTLGDKPKNDLATSSMQIQNNLKTESNRKLNVASFQIGENITRLEKEALKLKHSLSRHTKGSPMYNNIMTKYNEKQKELSDLRTSEKNIANEQNQRKNKAKLSVF